MKFLQGVALYSFAGWMIEGTYHKVTCGSFKRPHFSWLPFKPMYGIAAMLMIKCQKKGKWTAALGVSSIPALVEYISGYWLREHYGLQYWDYSQEKGNVQGLICPKFLACWALLGTMLLYEVQPKVERWLGSAPKVWQNVLSAASLLMVTDVECNLWRRHHDRRKLALNK